MNRMLMGFLMALMCAVPVYAQNEPHNFVLVAGGTFKNTKSQYFGTNVAVSSFYIGKYPVTQKEWVQVMGNNPSQFHGDDLPVEKVSWYDCIEYCNRRSSKEGFKPFYIVDKGTKDSGNDCPIDNVKWKVTFNAGADGYRLPTEAEYEYAAGGGSQSKNYVYSGSNDVEPVAWFWRNSGDTYLPGEWSWPTIERNHNRTKPVGGKAPNELGLYDMSGNVREWCWDWYGDVKSSGTDPLGNSGGSTRVWKGGGWLGGDFCCASSFRGRFEANGTGPDQGLRLCRSGKPVQDKYR